METCRAVAADPHVKHRKHTCVHAYQLQKDGGGLCTDMWFMQV